MITENFAIVSIYICELWPTDHDHDNLVYDLSRLSYSVTNFGDFIESSVSSDWEICSRNIVWDCCWKDDHGNPELFVLFTSLMTWVFGIFRNEKVLHKSHEDGNQYQSQPLKDRIQYQLFLHKIILKHWTYPLGWFVGPPKKCITLKSLS